MMKKIVLNSNTFVWKNHQSILFYNTDYHTYSIFPLDQDLDNLYEQWQDLENLYTAVPKEWTNSIVVLSQEIQEKNLGSVRDEKDRVFGIPPILKIKTAVEVVQAWDDDFYAENVLRYFHSLTVFLGGRGDNRDYWKQVPYPMTSNGTLDPQMISSLIIKYDNDYFQKANIIVSDIIPDTIVQLAESLSDHKAKVHFHFLFSDKTANSDIIHYLTGKGYQVNMICLDEYPLFHGEPERSLKYCLIVRSGDSLVRWNDIVKEWKDINHSFLPVADNNIQFFKENVFLSEEEILSQELIKKQVFAHQAVNKFNFGKLFLLPDATIRSLPDGPILDSEMNIQRAIVKELTENHAWRQTRRLMEPCKNCIYHDLCPSPSVYERILGVPGCTYWKG